MSDGRTLLLGESSGEPILLAQPSAEWAPAFASIQRQLSAALGPEFRVEHVGSTAIPGIPAKPVIDIQVSVPDLADEAAYVPAIESIGVELRVREPDLGHLYFRNSPRTIQVHVCPIGSKWERDHLLFRDYLRANPRVAADYAALKQASAEQYGDDRLAYTEAKGPFVEAALAAAEDWAAATGWQQRPFS